MRAKSRRYYQKNPLTTTELVVGGLVTAAVVGIGGYVLYQHFQNQAAANQNAQLAQLNAATGQSTLPGSSPMTPAEIGQAAALNQGQFATAQGGTAAPTTGTTFQSQ